MVEPPTHHTHNHPCYSPALSAFFTTPPKKWLKLWFIQFKIYVSLSYSSHLFSQHCQPKKELNTPHCNVINESFFFFLTSLYSKKSPEDCLSSLQSPPPVCRKPGQPWLEEPGWAAAPHRINLHFQMTPYGKVLCSLCSPVYRVQNITLF